ncbi:hypothetical protein [Microbispora sp. KK1-11]|uniref:hypothetical protein n=1 Tax=Microbispora sp. KK1-11 TaxID=2053005 RepID=UPI0021AE43A4|nr:hypothetical protein [Microbispora sp. KK1-11]
MGDIPPGWTIVLFANVRVSGQDQPSVLPLARPEHGRTVYEWGLPPACRTGTCELRGLRVEATPTGTADFEHPPGDLGVMRLDVRRDCRSSSRP